MPLVGSSSTSSGGSPRSASASPTRWRKPLRERADAAPGLASICAVRAAPQRPASVAVPLLARAQAAGARARVSSGGAGACSGR